MPVANDLHQRRARASWPARVVAIVAGLVLLLTTLAALDHETAVAHVRDGQSGELRHGHALAELHVHDVTPHLHGRDVEAHAEAGACALLAALDHPVLAPGGAPVPVHAALPSTPPRAGAVARDLTARARYRLAPKTSPPARA